jgi:hypothetical protein
VFAMRSGNWNCMRGLSLAALALAPALGQATELLDVSDVPEPATLAMLGLGLVGAAIARRRNKKKRK